MKKVILVLLLSYAGFAIAQNAKGTTNSVTKTSVSKKTKSPQIKFEKTVHDYGTIFEDDNGNCEFVFRNVGKEPLVLNNVYSSCGCTIPDWSKEPIMPGKSGVIKVKYNTSRLGKIDKTITVESNAENEPKARLVIVGQVEPKEKASYPEKESNPLQAHPKN